MRADRCGARGRRRKAPALHPVRTASSSTSDRSRRPRGLVSRQLDPRRDVALSRPRAATAAEIRWKRRREWQNACEIRVVGKACRGRNGRRDALDRFPAREAGRAVRAAIPAADGKRRPRDSARRLRAGPGQIGRAPRGGSGRLQEMIRLGLTSFASECGRARQRRCRAGPAHRRGGRSRCGPRPTPASSGTAEIASVSARRRCSVMVSWPVPADSPRPRRSRCARPAGPSFLRRRETWTSSVRSPPSRSGSSTCSASHAPRYRRTGPPRERREQVELDARQIDGARRPSAPPPPATSIASSPQRDDVGALQQRPAQPRAHARQQLLGPERLGQVVVGAEPERADLVGRVVARAEDQHRQSDPVRRCFSTSSPCAPGSMRSRMSRLNCPGRDVERRRGRLVTMSARSRPRELLDDLSCRAPDRPRREGCGSWRWPPAPQDGQSSVPGRVLSFAEDFP